MQIDEELTLKKLEVFLAFMRSGNLGKAAVELNTSNVSVHRAIHSLESALRCPLFKHEGRNLIPLESAYVLEERAQQLVKDVLETVRRKTLPEDVVCVTGATAKIGRVLCVALARRGHRVLCRRYAVRNSSLLATAASIPSLLRIHTHLLHLNRPLTLPARMPTTGAIPRLRQ